MNTQHPDRGDSSDRRTSPSAVGPTSDVDTDPRIARTRTVVLEAATALVSERGIARATVEAISERCGVARSTIYRHWPDRADLMLDAITLIASPFDVSDSGDLRTDLVDHFSQVADWLSSPQLGALHMSLISEARRDPQFAEIKRKITANRRQRALDIVMAGIKSGQLPADTDADQMVTDLAAPLFYRGLITHEPIDRSFVERNVDTCIRRHRNHV